MPLAWSKMCQALGNLESVVSLFQSYPDLDKMSHSQLDDFFNSCCLLPSQMAEIRDSPTKNSLYQKYITLFQINSVRDVIVDFHTYIESNKIFLTDELKNLFSQVDDLLWTALGERRSAIVDNYRKGYHNSFSLVNDKIPPIKRQIETLVQQRLHHQETWSDL